MAAGIPWHPCLIVSLLQSLPSSSGDLLFPSLTRTFDSCKDICYWMSRAAQSFSVMSNSVFSWTVASHAPLSIGFYRQEYWSGLSFPSPGDLPNSGFETTSPHWQEDSLSLSHWEALLDIGHTPTQGDLILKFLTK